MDIRARIWNAAFEVAAQEITLNPTQFADQVLAAYEDEGDS